MDFFVFSNKIFKFLSKDNEMLERNPMEKLYKKNQLMAFRHHGFWQCMDTQRDKDLLVKLIKEKKLLGCKKFLNYESFDNWS